MPAFFILLLPSLAVSLAAAPFEFPTPNRELLNRDGEAAFYTPTPGRSWESGQFGCVRSEGWRIHEGIDIACLERDRQGEPIDPVFASADGVVAYINRQEGLSNYGKYVVLTHTVDELPIYTLYAHLRQISPTLETNRQIHAGEQIGILGRTANTRSGISRQRAHLHFEIGLVLNPRFSRWFKDQYPTQRNEHGSWFGWNLVGLDPSHILRATATNPAFDLLEYVRTQKEMFRVLIRRSEPFPFVHQHIRLVRRNPTIETEGVAGYEIALNFNGVPFLLIPRAPSEIKPDSPPVELLSVDESEYEDHRCRQLIVRNGASWRLTETGRRHLELLTY